VAPEAERQLNFLERAVERRTDGGTGATDGRRPAKRVALALARGPGFGAMQSCALWKLTGAGGDPSRGSAS